MWVYKNKQKSNMNASLLLTDNMNVYIEKHMSGLKIDPQLAQMYEYYHSSGSTSVYRRILYSFLSICPNMQRNQMERMWTAFAMDTGLAITWMSNQKKMIGMIPIPVSMYMKDHANQWPLFEIVKHCSEKMVELLTTDKKDVILTIYLVFIQSVEMIERDAMHRFPNPNHKSSFDHILDSESTNDIDNIRRARDLMSKVDPILAFSPYALGHMVGSYTEDVMGVQTTMAGMHTDKKEMQTIQMNEMQINHTHHGLLWTIEYIKLYNNDASEATINREIEQMVAPLKAKLHQQELDIQIDKARYADFVTNDQFDQVQQQRRDERQKAELLNTQLQQKILEIETLKKHNTATTTHNLLVNESPQIIGDRETIILECQKEMAHRQEIHEEEIGILQKQLETLKQSTHKLEQDRQTMLDDFCSQKCELDERINQLNELNSTLKSNIILMTPNGPRRPGSGKPISTVTTEETEADQLREKLRLSSVQIETLTAKLEELKNKANHDAIATTELYDCNLTKCKEQHANHQEQKDKQIEELNKTIYELKQCTETNQTADTFIKELYKYLTNRDASFGDILIPVIESEMEKLRILLHKSYSLITMNSNANNITPHTIMEFK